MSFADEMEGLAAEVEAQLHSESVTVTRPDGQGDVDPVTGRRSGGVTRTATFTGTAKVSPRRTSTRAAGDAHQPMTVFDVVVPIEPLVQASIVADQRCAVTLSGDTFRVVEVEAMLDNRQVRLVCSART